ncbi:MAG: hypothetical protein ACRC4H_05430, partial [Plesiomonas sp.]
LIIFSLASESAGTFSLPDIIDPESIAWPSASRLSHAWGALIMRCALILLFLDENIFYGANAHHEDISPTIEG